VQAAQQAVHLAGILGKTAQQHHITLNSAINNAWAAFSGWAIASHIQLHSKTVHNSATAMLLLRCALHLFTEGELKLQPRVVVGIL
jgi:hypothetical protein